MTFIRGNRAIRDHIEDRKQLMLFKALGKGKPVEFLGEFECASIGSGEGPDRNGIIRKTIKFNLVPLTEQSAIIEDTPAPKLAHKEISFSDLREAAFNSVKPAQSTNWRLAKQIRHQRSNDIKEYVLERAGGVCELTGIPATFVKVDRKPYLEVHHIKRLSDGGLDHPVNCAAITPNAHREIHHGANGGDLDQQLVKIIADKELRLSTDT